MRTREQRPAKTEERKIAERLAKELFPEKKFVGVDGFQYRYVQLRRLYGSYKPEKRKVLSILNSLAFVRGYSIDGRKRLLEHVKVHRVKVPRTITPTQIINVIKANYGDLTVENAGADIKLRSYVGNKLTFVITNTETETERDKRLELHARALKMVNDFFKERDKKLAEEGKSKGAEENRKIKAIKKALKNKAPINDVLKEVLSLAGAGSTLYIALSKEVNNSNKDKKKSVK